MKTLKAKSLFGIAASLCVAAAAHAANIAVSGNIATSTTWTANNVYNLVGQIYVLPGATLTIEAGTQIKSNPADGGSLAITRGAKIYAIGTASKPIIFTVTTDPMTGPYQQIAAPGGGLPANFTTNTSANQWGNVTIMGKAYISASYKNNDGITQVTYQDGATGSIHTNTGSPDGLNTTTMEGLTAAFAGDPNVLYGGNDDNDDSGTLSYVSLRYGGKVIGLGNELNGLSMGGVGRETDVNHIDIWDNVDDGIETWGGTVNYKYLSIWNIGDDNFDVDQGWRGKAQFGLLVQGFSTAAGQGSGAGDNLMEIDGAERNDAQPMTTAVLYNFTCIGMPNLTTAVTSGGDQGIALRDEARVQIRNSIFMNVGENLIKEESSDAPGTDTWRYGTFGTQPYSSVWTSPFSEAWNKSNAQTGNHPNVAAFSQSFLQALYPTQVDGNLMEVSDCIFYSNLGGGAVVPYANTNGYNAVTGLVGNHNINNVSDDATALNTTLATGSPIKAITRGLPVSLPATPNAPATVMQPVLSLDPRGQNEAITSVGTAPADGFFTPVQYRGAFSKDVNWAKGWTAADAYGLMPAANTASAPVATAATLVTITSFPTVNGVIYTLEASSDGKNWSPVTTVTGDGTTKTVSSLTTVDPAKAYRVIAQ